MHGLTRGFLGAASNLKYPWKGAMGGGFGSMMGESLMEELAPSLHGLHLKASRGSLTQEDLLEYKTQLERASDLARLGTAFSSFALRQDVNASILTSTNAIENNSMQAFVRTLSLYQKHIEAIENNFHMHTILGGKDGEGLKKDVGKFIDLTKEGIKSFGEEGRGLGESLADVLNVDGLPKECLEKTGKTLGLGVGIGVNAIGLVHGKNAKVNPALRSKASHPNANLGTVKKPTSNPQARPNASPGRVHKVSAANTNKVVKKTEQKALLPGEGEVETYGELRIQKPGDNLSAHHMPHNNYMKSQGVHKKDGISMLVEDPYPGSGGRHREIHKSLKKQDATKYPREALAESVKVAKKTYKKDGVYTSEIRKSFKEVIKENKNTFPELFKKENQ